MISIRTLGSCHGEIHKCDVRFLQIRYQSYERKSRHGSGLRLARGQQVFSKIVSKIARSAHVIVETVNKIK